MFRSTLSHDLAGALKRNLPEHCVLWRLLHDRGHLGRGGVVNVRLMMRRAFPIEYGRYPTRGEYIAKVFCCMSVCVTQGSRRVVLSPLSYIFATK